MPTLLPVTENVGIYGACLLRVAKLGPDCAPLTGNNMAFVTTGIIDLTASPEVEEGAVIEPPNGCGAPGFSVRRPDLIKRWTLSGNLLYFDYEQLLVAFGGTAAVGKTGGPYAAKAIGWAPPDSQSGAASSVYLEVISQRAGQSAGDCVGASSGLPPYMGRIFPKARLTLGDWNQQNEHAPVSFTGVADRNPNVGTGPWKDSPLQGGYLPAPVSFTDYSQAQYDAIFALATAGHLNIA